MAKSFYFAGAYDYEAVCEFLERVYSVKDRIVVQRIMRRANVDESKCIIYRTPTTQERVDLRKRGYGRLNGIIDDIKKFYHRADCAVIDAATRTYDPDGEVQGEEEPWWHDVRNVIKDERTKLQKRTQVFYSLPIDYSPPRQIRLYEEEYLIQRG
jgi:hypothetical protein